MIQRSVRAALFIQALVTAVYPLDCSATLPTIAFWKNRKPILSFTTSPQSLLSSLCSGVVTVQTANASNVATNVSSDLSVNLTGSSGVTFYSDANCTQAISSVTVTSGTHLQSFYLVATQAGSNNIQASATNYSPASQTETLSANPYIWTGAGGNTAWANAGNWSGGAVPGASNIAVFDGTCGSTCNALVSASTTVGGVRMTSSYTGSIGFTPTRSLTVNSNGGWIQFAGTFNGGSGSHTINGAFILLGGTYNSTSGVLNANVSTWTVGSATFNSGSGQIFFGAGAKTITPGNVTYGNVSFLGGPFDYNTIVGTMNVGNLSSGNTDGRSSLDNGIIAVTGNVSFSDHGYTGTAKIKLQGSSNQTLSASGTPSWFPAIEVASTGGTVTFTGNINVSSNFTYTSGTVTLSGTNFNFYSYGNPQIITPGPLTFNNVAFTPDSYAVVTVSGTMKVAGNVTLSCLDGRTGFSGGTVEVSSDLTTTSSCNHGTTLFSLVGTTNQAIHSASSTYTIPNLKINSTGGTVSLTDSFSLNGHFYYVAGSVNTGTSTVTLMNSDSMTFTVDTGSMSFYNVVMKPDAYAQISLATPMNIAGNLTLSSLDGRTAVSGTYKVSGNVTSTSALNGGGASIQLIGSGGSAITVNAGASLPSGNITVNKSGGAGLTLGSALTLTSPGQTLTLTAGNADMAGYNLSVSNLSLNGNTLSKAGGTLTVNGSVVSGTGSLFGGTVN
ncbi:MAG: beta strand repeat-containing protein [Bdellovibrionia bacterium]